VDVIMRVYFNFIKEEKSSRKSSSGLGFAVLAMLLAVNAALIFYCRHLNSTDPTAPPHSAGTKSHLAAMDLRVFDTPAVRGLKTAFESGDSNYLKRLSQDLFDINCFSGLSPFSVFSVIEKAYSPSLFIDCVHCEASGLKKISARITGFSPANSFFINFSDYISKQKGVSNFSFETRAGEFLYGGKSYKGVNFTINFDADRSGDDDKKN